MKTLLFVYGTLKKGYSLNAHTLTAKHNSPFVDFLGEATIEGYEMFSNGSFPYIMSGDGTITGEVYEVRSEELLQTLREIEGAYEETPVQAA